MVAGLAQAWIWKVAHNLACSWSSLSEVPENGIPKA